MSVEIIGWNEYQEFLMEWKDCGTRLRGKELHLFHPTFRKLLEKDKNIFDSPIYLDYTESFSHFPVTQGIYFCIRAVEYSNACEIWYIGKALNFQNRWRNHHKFQALRAIKGVFVYFLQLEDYSKEQINRMERIYIEMLCPVFNDTSSPEKHLRVA